MITTLLVAFLASFSTALLLVLTTRWHGAITADAPGAGPQKLHERATPRVGGIAVMAGFALAVVAARVQLPADNGTNAPPWFNGWLILALFVPFAAGLIEDVTKSFGARLRLLATFVGAGIAYYFCEAALSRFAVPPLDALLAASPLAQFVLTLFCVGAIANAYNLADGLNGLLAGLADAAEDHVLDQRRVAVGARDQRVEHLGGEVGRVPARQFAVAAAAGGAGGGNDEGFGHGGVSWVQGGCAGC